MNPKSWLRLEGGAELALLIWLYAQTGSNWYWFAGLFLLPDLGMLGYLIGTRTGAWSYNIMHTYAVTIPLAAAGLVASQPLVISIAVIWSAHIAFDRMVGYGLKFEDAFQNTHLNSLRKPAQGQD